MTGIGLPGVALAERDHVCVFHRGADERDAFLTLMVGAGLADGDRCLCIADTDDPEALADRLDPQHPERPDRLTILPTTAYLTDGEFLPERVFSQWDSILGGYVAEGHRHLRGTGELGWFLRRQRAGADPRPLFEYEALCNTLVKRRPATIFCLYDLDLLDAELLPGVLRHHPSAIANGTLFRAPWSSADALRLAEQLVAGARRPQEMADLLAGMRRAVTEVEEAGRLLRDLLDGTPPGPAGADTLRSFGVDLDAPLRAVVVRPQFAAEGIRLVAQNNGETAFVTNDEASDGFTRSGRTVGLGRLRSGPDGAARSYAEARRAADLAERLGRPVLRHEDLGFLSLLAEGGDGDAMADFVAEWLGPLLAHDERRAQKLLPTAAAYLDAGAAQQATADDLGIHVSTLKYRLGRIEAILGRDLSVPDVRFQLQVALASHRTLGELRRDRPVP